MTESFTAAWEIDERDFPAHGSPMEALRFALRYAILAPSGHNGQPWKFHIDGDLLQVRADRGRGLPTIDPLDREMLISCAATVHLTRVALEHFGYRPVITLLPDPANPDLLASVRLGKRGSRRDIDQLFDAVLDRHCNRKPYESRPVSEGPLSRLRAAAETEGAWLQPVTDAADIAAAADLIARGDRSKWRERLFRHELAERIVPNRGRRRDGMPGYAFGVPGPFARMAPACVRHLDLGRIRANSDRRLAIASPMLAVIGTDSDDVPAWMTAGAALSHVLLQATADGLATSFLSQAIEVDSLRPRLAALLSHGGYPQVLLRVGYCRHPARPAPRRPLHEVLTTSDPPGSGQLSRRDPQPQMQSS